VINAGRNQPEQALDLGVSRQQQRLDHIQGRVHRGI
jgi:hypothetical protein